MLPDFSLCRPGQDSGKCLFGCFLVLLAFLFQCFLRPIAERRRKLALQWEWNGILNGIIMELEPPDSHHLSAAIGWLGLGSDTEAIEELEKISSPNRAYPSVLAVKFEIFSKNLPMDLSEALPECRC
jgi:hypothetical protein